MNKKNEQFKNLPTCVADYIKLVIKKIRWRKKVREDVQAELIAHFEDALCECKTNEEKGKKAKELIDDFGDAELIAILTRRAKKRCRPLWQKILIRSFQALGIIIIYVVICGVYVNWGKPNITVNYVEWLNDYVRQGRDESLNSAPKVQKAAKLAVQMPEWLSDSNAKWPSDFNDTQMSDFENWLMQNKPAFGTLKTALLKPLYWNIYDANNSDLMKFDYFSVSEHRTLARALDWQIKYSAFKNNSADAVEKAVELFDLGQRMEGNGLLIEQLVGVAIEAIGNRSVFDLLDKTQLTPHQLTDIQIFLQHHYNDTVIDMSGEKALIYDFIQRNFTDDGKGGGKPVSQGTGFAGKNTFEIILKILTFNLPDKKDVISQMENFYAGCRQAFETPDIENMKKQLENISSDSPMLMKSDLPAFGKVGELSWRTKMQREALITTLAILRYKQEMGNLPQSLDELLQAGYIKQMPFDIYRNGPLTYKRIDTCFILYSFGIDRDDDGGRMGISKEGRPNLWNLDGGDAVFWPIANNPGKK